MNSPAPPAGAPSGAVVLAGAAVAAAALAAYSGSFGGPFVLDDDGTIGANPTIRHLLSALSPPRGGLPVSGRPVTNLSFAVNYAISGTHVWSYHALNLLIHILAALVLFGIVRRTLERVRGHGEGPSRDRADFPPVPLAFAVAVLWAVHPLQTAAVTYLSQRAESLMGLFYLLTLYGFIRGAGAGGRSLPWLGLSGLACLLGMAAKEAMATAPIMVFLYDRTFVAGTAAGAWRARGKYHVALASTWLALAFLVLETGGRGGTAGFGASVPWWAYALTQVGAVAHYLWLSVWPHPLLADYGRTLGGRPLEDVAALLLELALMAAAIRALRCPAIKTSGERALGFAGAWFFLILAPSSSVVPVATELIAEHRMYLPLAGVLAAIVCGGWAGVSRLRRRFGWSLRATAVAGGLALAAAASSLVAATIRRNDCYRSLLAFWSDVVRTAPQNAGARNNLGNVLAEKGDLAGAAGQYREALRIAPEYVDADVGLANVLFREGRKDEAADRYRAALALNPGLAEVHNNLGVLLAQAGRFSEAGAEFEAAVRLEPGYREARDNLERVKRIEAERAQP